MSHTVQHLRAALFRQIDALRSPGTDTADAVSRARATSEVARTILETAKLEIEYARMTGQSSVDFLALPEPEPAVKSTAHGTLHREGNVIRHVMK